MSNPSPAPCASPARSSRSSLDVFRALPKRPFQVKEFIQQAWFIASVTILPTALVSIPFGAVIALQLGTLTRQLGAQSYTGAASVLAVMREASPIVTALLIAGAGGSAICADLGSRKIREEIDAMEVLGISPIQRLVVPRVLASMLVAVLLNGLVSVVGVAGGYFFNVIIQGGTPGAYIALFTALAQLPDLWTSEIKALIFGFIAAVVASYKGLNAGGGPKGVGDAVNQSVVITFMLLFVVNFVVTRRVLPSRPAEDLRRGDGDEDPDPTEHGAAARPRGPARRARSTRLGEQMRFYVRSLAWSGRTLRRYKKEVVRLLAEVSLGTGALSVIGGTVGVIAFLAFFTGTRSACRATPRSSSSAPAPSPASSRPTSTPARSPRSSRAWRSRRRSAAASPPSSARCASPRRSTRSRSWASRRCRSS